MSAEQFRHRADLQRLSRAVGLLIRNGLGSGSLVGCERSGGGRAASVAVGAGGLAAAGGGRVGLALYLAPRERPFVLVGGATGALGVWSAAPMTATAVTAFLVAFQVKAETLTKPHS